jgi:hypothetical protein
MTWILNNRELEEKDLDGYKAFVYCIYNELNGKKYIGKKKIFFSKTKQVNKKKKKVQVISDYQTYYGSSKELQDDVEKFGKENFKREILHLCKTPAESSYLEIYEQIIRNALLSDDYYNAYIGCRISKSHVKGLINEFQIGNHSGRK